MYRREGLGSTDEFTHASGDRVACGLNDPARPSSTSTQLIPVRSHSTALLAPTDVLYDQFELVDRLYSLKIDDYPAHYTLQHLSDLLTLPGHSPPIGLTSVYSRQRQLSTQKASKHGYAAFESVSTRKAVVTAMKRYREDDDEYLAVSNMHSRYWAWQAFPRDFKERYEKSHSDLRPSHDDQRRIIDSPLDVRPSHDDHRRIIDSPLTARPSPRYQVARFGTSIIPQELMLNFPLLHIKHLPLNSPLVRPEPLRDYFGTKVDRDSILGIFIGDVTDLGSLPVYMVLKTVEAANLFGKLPSLYRFSAIAEDLALSVF